MELNPQETRAGTRWFFLAGLFAIAFAFGLVKTDDFLTESKREQVLRDTLLELRTAQASLPSRSLDERALDLTAPAR